MFLRIIIAVFCFSPLYSFSMDHREKNIQSVDSGWFLAKLVEYKRAHGQRQNHDYVIAYLQKKSQNCDSILARRVGIAPSGYGVKAKL